MTATKIKRAVPDAAPGGLPTLGAKPKHAPADSQEAAISQPASLSILGEGVFEDPVRAVDEQRLRKVLEYNEGQPVISVHPADEEYFSARGWNTKITGYGSNEQNPGGPSLRLELERMRRVVELERSAGDPQTRAALAKQAEEAAQVLGREEPKILQQIDQLQAELNRLRRDSELAERRSNEANAAVSGLRALAPDWLKRQVQARCKAVCEANAGLGPVKSRVREIKKILGLTPDEQAWHCFHLPADHPMHVGAAWGTVPAERWDDYVAPLRAELERIEPEYEAMQAKHDREMALAEDPLNYYAR